MQPRFSFLTLFASLNDPKPSLLLFFAGADVKIGTSEISPVEFYSLALVEEIARLGCFLPFLRYAAGRTGSLTNSKFRRVGTSIVAAIRSGWTPILYRRSSVRLANVSVQMLELPIRVSSSLRFSSRMASLIALYETSQPQA